MPNHSSRKLTIWIYRSLYKNAKTSRAPSCRLCWDACFRTKAQQAAMNVLWSNVQTKCMKTPNKHSNACTKNTYVHLYGTTSLPTSKPWRCPCRCHSHNPSEWNTKLGCTEAANGECSVSWNLQCWAVFPPHQSPANEASMEVDTHNDLHEANAASAMCDIVLKWSAGVSSTHCIAHHMCPQSMYQTTACSAVLETQTKGRGPLSCRQTAWLSFECRASHRTACMQTAVTHQQY